MAIKILITGTQGQVAQALAERARNNPDLTVLLVGRPTLDLESVDTIDQAVASLAPDVVVNAAAYTAVDSAEANAPLAMRINGDGAGHVARATKRLGAKLIHLSTDYVYDGTKSSPYVETDEVAPQSVYGASKLAGEIQVHHQHPEATILRTAWVYSPFGQNFVKTMVRLATDRDHLTVVDDQHGNPTSAFVIADSILALIERWRTEPTLGAGAQYHCAGTGDATWCTLARHTLAASRANGGPYADVTPISTSDWPTAATRPLNSRLDCSKLWRDLSWQAPAWETSVTEVVKRLLADQHEDKD